MGKEEGQGGRPWSGPVRLWDMAWVFQAWLFPHQDSVTWQTWPWAHMSHLIILAVTSQRPGHSQLSKSRETERGRVQGCFPQLWEAASRSGVIVQGSGRPRPPGFILTGRVDGAVSESAGGGWKRLGVIARHCADRALRRKASPLTVQMSLKGPALRTVAAEAGQTLLRPCLGSANKPWQCLPSLT